MGGGRVVAQGTFDLLHPGHVHYLREAAAMGDHLRTELAAAVGEDVREIRGQGLMIGIEVKRGANRLLPKLALEHGVLALPAGRSVLRLLPPLTVEREHCDAVVEALAEVL